jgi:hypothetical protein
MIASDGGFLDRIGQFGPIWRRQRADYITNLANVIQLDQLLPYLSRRVTVAFEYAEVAASGDLPSL